MTAHEVFPKEYAALNSAFYEDVPSSYFRTRLSLTVALCDSSQPLNAIFEAGVSFAGVKVTSPAGSEEELEGFATIELLSLEHLVCETLLRQFLAHVERPYCPPIEMARLTDFREFKRRVKHEIVEAVVDDSWIGRVRTVFRGDADRESFESISQEVWDADGEYLAGLLKYSASVLLDGAKSYNSYKHGLGIQPSRPYVKIGKEESDIGVLLEHAGPAVSFLHRERSEDGSWQWVRSTAFVSIELAAGTIALMLEELDALWAVARSVYLSDRARVSFQHADRHKTLLNKYTARGVLALVISQRFPRPEAE